MSKFNLSKSKKRNIILGLMFFVGFLIAIYPVISNLYYRQVATEEINSFIKKSEEMPAEELNRKMELARAYNKTLDPSRLSDPYSDKEKEGIAEYARMLEVEEKIGFVRIPKINQDLPVYAGTSDRVLDRGCGHLEGTSLPIGGENTHSVITAHRGLPKAKLFRELDKLKEGDIFYFQNINTTLAYEVDQIITVEPWDFEPVLVIEGEDMMTLLTCTPYMINSHRLLVRGHRVDYVAPVQEDTLANIIPDFTYRDYLPFALIILLVLFAIAVYYFIDYRKVKKKVEDISNEKKN